MGIFASNYSSLIAFNSYRIRLRKVLFLPTNSRISRNLIEQQIGCIVDSSERQQNAEEILGSGIENNTLPAFSKTADRLAQISGADDQNLSELSAIILNDPGMTSRILRASNSAYRVRRGKTNSVSRAVVMLGVDEVKRICLGSALVEGLIENGATDKLVDEMARAFHAATQARMIAVQKGERNSEEIFIAALLKSLGPLMYWGASGDESEEFLSQLDPKDRPPEEAEKELLGVELIELSEYIVDKWNLSSLLPTEDDEDPKRRERARRVALCTRLARRSNLGAESDYVTNMHEKLEVETGLPESVLNTVFATSAQEAASAANFFGAPQVADVLIKMSAKLSGRKEEDVLAEIQAQESATEEASSEGFQSEASGQGAHEELVDDTSQETIADIEVEASEEEADKRWAGKDELTKEVSTGEDSAPESDPDVQLATLREISSLMLSQADPSIILGKILFGMRNGIGLDRVLFAIVDKSAGILTGRIALGAAGPTWHERCRFVIEEGNFLWNVAQNPNPRWVKGQELADIPHHMQVVFGRGEFIIAPVITNGNFVAAFYGDRRQSKRELSEEICAAFGQFALQGTFALSGANTR